MRSRYLLPFLFIFAAQTRLFSQLADLNVKVRATETQLIAGLHQMAAQGGSGSDPAFRTLLPFAEKIRVVHALSTPENTELSACFNLIWEGEGDNSLLNRLLTSGKYEYAERNGRRSVDEVLGAFAAPPSDTGVALQWYHTFIQTFSAWDSSRGDTGVVVGVLDTGLDYLHPEFQGRIALNHSEDRNGNGTFEAWHFQVMQNGMYGDIDGVDNDGNGFADDVIGYDFTDQPRSPFGGDYLGQDPDPMDENDHGTLVAGIIAANAANGSGGTGIAPLCRLRVLRAFSASGTGEDDDIARAIVYAADNGIPILNFSFGDVYESRTLHDAIRYAASKNVVMVASAGNTTGDSPHFPSGFPETISVSASDLGSDRTTETLWPLSSFGNTVDLAAPGNNIYCPVIHDPASGRYYNYFSGTSTSAPMVSAAVALLFSHKGTFTPAEVRGLLCSSTDDILSQGWDIWSGAGRLNIAKLLRQPAASRVELQSAAGSAGDSVWLEGSVLHPQLQSWDLFYASGTETPLVWIPILHDSGQVREDSLACWRTDTLPEGEYTLRLKANLSGGNSIEDRLVFVRDTSANAPRILYAGEIWDNDLKKIFISFRCEDKGSSSLLLRSIPAGQQIEIPFDRITRNGYFVTGSEVLQPGSWEYSVRMLSLSGIPTESPADTFVWSPEGITRESFEATGTSLPMGAYLNLPLDLDGDGRMEVMMSEYDSTLSFGALAVYEYNAGVFVKTSAISTPLVLIPKDCKDLGGDGRMEVLASVNDSFYVFSQDSLHSAAFLQTAKSEGQSRYPARWYDADGDLQQEVIAKDARDYYILKQNGSDFNPSAVLPDSSPGYEGSVAPKALCGDFDGDGNTDIAYGDYDGDLLIYERNASGNYHLQFLDTTDLYRSGSYLCQGDFDGDGSEELFVAAHSSLLRNDDFEYDAPFWWLRIFKATGNDQYAMAWNTFLFDIDSETYNAANAVNADADPESEILFSTYPRTYLLDYKNGGWTFSWFHYGAICTHHVSGDFNGNGISEFALGRGDSAFFFEWDQALKGPVAPLYLDGRVLGSASVQLDWIPSPDATEYLVFRGDYDTSGTQVALIDSTSSLVYHDSNLVSDHTYLYVLLSKNPAMTPVYGTYFSNVVLLRPHAPFRADSARLQGLNTVNVWLSQALADDPLLMSRIWLDSTQHPVSVIASGDSLHSVLLGFDPPPDTGLHHIQFDSLTEDRFRGRIDPAYSQVSFSRIDVPASPFYLSQWYRESSSQAVLRFTIIPGSGATDPSNYSVYPAGYVTSAERIPGDSMAIRLHFAEVVLGSVGYPVTVTVSQVASVNGDIIPDKEGNAATFLSSEESLASVYVYPNPYTGNDFFNGIRFANLSSDAVIQILSASGRKVITLRETDADGGVEWNLQDNGGNRVKPGTYLYQIRSEKSGEEKTGCFSIVE